MMSENIARNMYSSQGTINYPTQLHLVCHFRILCHDARKHEYQAYNECNSTVFHTAIPVCVNRRYAL